MFVKTLLDLLPESKRPSNYEQFKTSPKVRNRILNYFSSYIGGRKKAKSCFGWSFTKVESVTLH